MTNEQAERLINAVSRLRPWAIAIAIASVVTAIVLLFE